MKHVITPYLADNTLHRSPQSIHTALGYCTFHHFGILVCTWLCCLQETIRQTSRSTNYIYISIHKALLLQSFCPVEFKSGRNFQMRSTVNPNSVILCTLKFSFSLASIRKKVQTIERIEILLRLPFASIELYFVCDFFNLLQ